MQQAIFFCGGSSGRVRNEAHQGIGIGIGSTPVGLVLGCQLREPEVHRVAVGC